MKRHLTPPRASLGSPPTSPQPLRQHPRHPLGFASQVFCPHYSFSLPAAGTQKQAGKHISSFEKLLPSPGKRLLPWRGLWDTCQRGPAATGTCCSRNGLILPHDVTPVTPMTEGDVRKQDYRLVLQRAGVVRGDENIWFQHRLPAGSSTCLPRTLTSTGGTWSLGLRPPPPNCKIRPFDWRKRCRMTPSHGASGPHHPQEAEG